MIDIAVIQADDVVSARFEDATDTWLLDDGRRARVVVDERRLHTPRLPEPNDFRGPAFHQTEWDPALDAAGRRIAVIGPRAAHVAAALTRADVTLFYCPRQMRETKRRWLPHRPAERLRAVMSPVDRITRVGVRSADGTEHVVDAIVHATGCLIKPGLPGDALVGSRGLTIHDAWHDAATAYLGVAVHGFPNYFLRRGSTRIEVRRSAQQQFTQRARVKPPAPAFDFGHHPDHDIYDGPATLTIGADAHAVRARGAGHFDPIDGRYHWRVTVFGATTELPKRWVTITTDSLTSRAKITEHTPWGSYSIAGVGAPPYDFT